MPIDPTIPLGIRPPAPTNFGQTIGTASGLLGLMGDQQRLQANQILSEAYKQSTDPTTGETDFGRLQAIVSQSPAAAFLPDFMGKIAQQRNSQVQYDQSKLNLLLTQQGEVRNRIGSLMSLPGYGKEDLSGDIVASVQDMVQGGFLPVAQAAREIMSIPKDPAGQAQWVKQHYLTSLGGEAKIRAMLPQTQTVDTGGSVNIVPVDPMTGQVAGNITALKKSLTPGEASANVTVIDPNTGAQYQITKEQQLRMQGQPAGSQGYTGRLPSGAASAVPGGVLSGLGPSEQARMSAGATAQATQSATAAQGLADAAADAPMRLNLLEQARDVLGNIQTGPGTDWRNTAASFINSLPGGMAAKLGVTNPNEIASYDEFKKILTNYASSISGSMGSGTDARLNAAITGNANPNISKLANEDILTKTIAAERMRQAQAYAFQNADLPPDQFTKWQTQWNKEVNPDTFVFTSMTPAQQQKFISRKSKDGSLGKFKSDLAKLVRSGVIEMPGRPDAGGL